jgi:hypothetical protein
MTLVIVAVRSTKKYKTPGVVTLRKEQNDGIKNGAYYKIARFKGGAGGF